MVSSSDAGFSFLDSCSSGVKTAHAGVFPTHIQLSEPSLLTYMPMIHPALRHCRQHQASSGSLTLYAAILFGMSAMFLAMSSSLRSEQVLVSPVHHLEGQLIHGE